MPVLFEVKLKAKSLGVIRNQFPQSKLPPELQDPALAWYANEKGYYNEYRAYHFAFSRALATPQRPFNEDEAEKWLQVAITSSATDDFVRLTGSITFELPTLE